MGKKYMGYIYIVHPRNVQNIYGLSLKPNLGLPSTIIPAEELRIIIPLEAKERFLKHGIDMYRN